MAGVMCEPLTVSDEQTLNENGDKIDVADILTKGTYIESFLHNNIKTNQLEISTDSKTFKTFAKLKEPRDLFALPKELDCPQQAARWPTECQVVEEKIQHITWIPATPEPYYVKTGKELQPQPVGEDAGTVVFQYYPMSAVNYFSRSSVGGSRIYLSACASANSDDDLRFESRFESGNLAKAIRITSSYYELHLRTDLYTNRHMQWFYFRVSNTTKNMTYRFSIVNLSKPNSLYNDGMRPLLYSTKDAQLHSIGWKRCGDNIAYYRNDPTCEEEEQNPTYTLTFNIQFPHSEDSVYLAHCFPYTYSDLQEYLSKLQAHPVKSMFTKLRLLCRTLAGNNVYYLTITSPTNPNDYIEKKKKAIVITARVHPGETPASWMMKGFMDFLTGDTSQAKELRDKFIFKLVPMLNPDGVIVGNNRCSLTGKDLNRQYRTVIRETYPSVWHTKVLVRRLQEECGVAMFVDLHAHSRRHNVFIYGCESRRGSEKRLHEQVFPLMLHKNAADKFSFESCKFRIQRSKEGTGRVVVWMMGIANSYTMEATFAGSELGSRMSTHFTTQDYENIGKTFCETLLDFYDDDPSKEKLRAKIISRLLKEGSSADEPTNIDLSDYSSDEGDTSTSSSEGDTVRCDLENETSILQPAPPPSPVLNNVLRANNENTKKSLLKIEKAARSPNRLTVRKTLSVNQATIDLISDVSTDGDSADESSPTRRIRTLFRSSNRSKKNRRGKKMPPELTITPVQTNGPVLQTENDKEQLRSSRSKSLTVPIKPSLSHQFRSFPVPKCLTELKSVNRNIQPAELEVKLTSLKKTTLWTRSPGDNEPLSWGISSFAKNAYFTEGETLLRLCSKKLEELETYGDREEKNKTAKRKNKNKSKQTLKPIKIADETSAIMERKPFQSKKKKKKKKANQETHSLDYSPSFSEARKPIAKSYSCKEDFNPTRSFRKSGYVATAIQHKATQNKSSKKIYSDQSDSDGSNDSIRKTKRPTKSIKIKLFKTKSNESRK